jgi:hypothetical protein
MFHIESVDLDPVRYTSFLYLHGEAATVAAKNMNGQLTVITLCLSLHSSRQHPGFTKFRSTTHALWHQVKHRFTLPIYPVSQGNLEYS